MSALDVPPDNDKRLAARATGLLAQANRRGLLDAADVHVAGRLSELTGESDDRVRLALGLAVRAVRTGSVACDLDAAVALDPDFPWPFAPAPAGSADREGVSPLAEKPRALLTAGSPEPEDARTASPETEPGARTDGDEAQTPSGLPAGTSAWLALVAASPLVAERVLVVEFGLLYLERYWEQEVLVARALHDRAALGAVNVDHTWLSAALDRLFPDTGDADQRSAGESAVRHRTVIVTGGPGTGKTTTIAKIVALLAEEAERGGALRPPRIALAAPTAKAAARLAEAFRDATVSLPAEDRARIPALPASTLHRLLGWIPESRSRFKHDRSNRLPHDVVVLDEASMISLTLMSRLLESLRPAARLIIAGDPDQLASVEAGAVLADLVWGLGGTEPVADGGEPAYELGSVARLARTYRFGGAIGELAQAIRAGDAERAARVLEAGDGTVRLLGDPVERKPLMVSSALALRDLALAPDDGDERSRRALAALARHRLLCAHRTGPFGVTRWNRQIEQWLAEETGDNFWATMYPGRPLLVTANDYAMDLYNGYTGVVLRREHRLVAVFDAGSTVREVAASRLSDVETMHAATIHKSQGSQAESVTVVLPEVGSPLLTRELIYTAVTRAQRELTIIGTIEALAAGISRPVQRASGLRQRLLG